MGLFKICYDSKVCDYTGAVHPKRCIKEAAVLTVLSPTYFVNTVQR